MCFGLPLVVQDHLAYRQDCAESPLSNVDRRESARRPALSRGVRACRGAPRRLPSPALRAHDVEVTQGGGHPKTAIQPRRTYLSPASQGTRP